MDSLGPPSGLAICFHFEEDISISSSQRSLNSFLHETDHNSNIPDEVRDVVETKYLKAAVNAKYVFPRTKAKSAVESTASTREFFTRKSKALQVRHMRRRSEVHPILLKHSPYALPLRRKLPLGKLKLSLSPQPKRRVLKQARSPLRNIKSLSGSY
jgi:hypothetical protein